MGLAGLVASGAAARGPFASGNPGWGSATEGGYQATYSVVRIDPYASAYAHRYYQAEYNYYDRDAERHTRGYQHVRLRASDDYDDDPRPRKRGRRVTVVSSHPHASVAAHLNYGGREPVCVRLCDGFFFPLTGASYDTASQSAACNSLCPDAPTEVYYKSGSDRIEDSISEKGQPYTFEGNPGRFETLLLPFPVNVLNRMENCTDDVWLVPHAQAPFELYLFPRTLAKTFRQNYSIDTSDDTYDAWVCNRAKPR